MSLILVTLISPPKTVKFSFVLSSTVVETARVEINAIPFVFCEVNVRSFKIRITAWRNRNQNRWHSFLRFSADFYVMLWFSFRTTEDGIDFVDIWTFELSKLCPGVGIFFLFLARGPAFCVEKLSSGWGFWRKRTVVRGLARTKWYPHKEAVSQKHLQTLFITNSNWTHLFYTGTQSEQLSM